MQEAQEMWIWSLMWKIPWSQKWQFAPVSLFGKFHRQKRLVGYSPWGNKESDMTDCTHAHTHAPSLQDPGYQAIRNSDHGSWETKEVSLTLSQSHCPEGFQDTVQSCRDLRILTISVNWGDSSWVLETQKARVQILEYREKHLKHLNVVSYLWAFSRPAHVVFFLFSFFFLAHVD